jgi:hypothetical protein
MPDIDTSAFGPSSSLAMVEAISPVPLVRLSRSSRLRSSVQRLSPMLAPARWITTSHPASASVSISPVSGFQ